MTAMSTPSDLQAAALLAHVVSQMKQNVEFMVSQNYITQADGSNIIAKLPSPGFNLIPGMEYMNVNPPSIPRGALPPAPIAPTPVRARALWAYNENGQEADDLSFSAGDIVEIINEENDDWWMGKVNGKQALFPSSYVEKIAAPPTPAVKAPYRPFMAAHHGADAPPAQGVNSVGLQQAPGQAEKKGTFNKYKSTMAHSAAGGVGFGAGAAIGGGLVRAIF